MKYLILFLTINLLAGSEGLFRVYRSSFPSDAYLTDMRNDIVLLNSQRQQPPEFHWEAINVSTNTNPAGIIEGYYHSEFIIDDETTEILFSGHPDLAELSKSLEALSNGWMSWVATVSWNENGWIQDAASENYKSIIEDFRERFYFVVEVSTP